MNDAAAIIKLRQGDENAFTILFSRYSDRVCHFLFRFVREREISRELTQDIFLKIWLSRETIDPERSFETYLFSISRYHVYNFLKRRVKDESVRLSVTNSTVEADPHDEQEFREIVRIYRRSVQELKPASRSVFLMSREAGLTYPQIAEKMNISVSSVEKHMSAALSSLKKNLQDADILFLLLFGGTALHILCN